MQQEKEQRTEIGELGEFGLIDHLTKSIELKNSNSLVGIGDDAAIINVPEKAAMVVSTDMLVEGIHFDLMYHPMQHLGYKAVVVNLSDIYAMNAVPTQITVSLAISNRFSVEALDQLYEGINYACERYGVDVVGGDTTSSQKGLIISITAIGHQSADKLSMRSGAKPGDVICATGDFGAAFLGLQMMEREKKVFLEAPGAQPDLENEKYLIGRLLKPEPRKDIIDLLEDYKIVPSAMIDVSDGLSSELMHIAKASKVGVKIQEGAIPILEDTRERAFKFNMDPTLCALSGGEDYELLFTVKPEEAHRLAAHPEITIIGDVLEPKEGMKMVSKAGKVHDLKAQGWNSFNA